MKRAIFHPPAAMTGASACRSTPPALAYLEAALSDAADRGLRRERPEPHPNPASSFCSNDYLALADRARPEAASGSGASRLVVGEHAEHRRLEACSASWVGCPSALAFSSGYAANVGLISALAGPDDLIVSDALNHASLIDGARLARARVAIVAHLDVSAVARVLSEYTGGRAFVVTESYFSMDADAPNLRALREICDAHSAALIVDEAHALGVLGPQGRGLCFEAGVRADAVVGTYGKAFGAAGAFVAGCPTLIDWLWNRARSFVFSTGLSPALAAAARHAMSLAESEPWRRQRVLAAAGELREGLLKLGVVPKGFGHIVPWVLGEAAEALRVAAALKTQGLDVRPIRPPSVPPRTARIRFTVTAAHAPADVGRALESIARALGQSALRPPASGQSALGPPASGPVAS